MRPAITKRTTSSPAPAVLAPITRLQVRSKGPSAIRTFSKRPASWTCTPGSSTGWAHPFHYHEQDWDVQEETETFAKAVETPITFGDLDGNFYLPRPAPATQHVDHRYGVVNYYPNQSYIGMHDDGGVVIGDGYGAEIRMCGGHIFLTAPGDIWTKPGRNLNVMAGHDVCLRAYNSMDLSTTTKDLRFKAENNLHMLGGNNGKLGGVLVECKAPSSYNYANVVGENVVMGGFQVKVAQGDAVIWARNIYLRTGGGDVAPGFIVIDAAAGQQTITFNAATIASYVTSSISDNFTSANGNVETINVWSAVGNTIGADTYVQGFGTFAGDILLKGWVLAVGGHFASELADAYDGYVASLGGIPLVQDYQVLATDSDNTAKAVTSAETYWQTLFNNDLYSASGAGNADVIKLVHFTFRNPAQYLTQDFQLFEDRWQQLARLAGEELTVWNEVAITGASSEDTMPYPGKAPWNDNNTFMEMDLNLYNPSTGVSLPRTKTPAGSDANGPPTPRVTESKYEAPTFADPKAQPPAKGYMIIS